MTGISTARMCVATIDMSSKLPQAGQLWFSASPLPGVAFGWAAVRGVAAIGFGGFLLPAASMATLELRSRLAFAGESAASCRQRNLQSVCTVCRERLPGTAHLGVWLEAAPAQWTTFMKPACRKALTRCHVALPQGCTRRGRKSSCRRGGTCSRHCCGGRCRPPRSGMARSQAPRGSSGVGSRTRPGDCKHSSLACTCWLRVRLRAWQHSGVLCPRPGPEAFSVAGL